MADINWGSVIGGGVSGLFGLAQTALNNKYARENADRDREQNYIYGEMAARNADARTRALYNDFYSPEAMLRQYKEAGLSPAMMYGGTPGQGGMSGAQGSGGAGMQTPFMPYSLLEAAQVANLFAQAKKTNKEAEQIQPLAESTIAKQLADAGHAEAAKAALEAQTEGQKLDNYIKQNTKEANIFTICELADQTAYATTKMYNEMRSAKVLADIDEKLYETKVEEGKKQLELLSEDIINTKANTNLTKEQKKQVKVDMLACIDEVQQKWKALDIQEKQTKSYTDWIEAQIPYIEKQLEIKFKELGIQRWKVAVDGVTNTIKAICIGAAAASQFGKGSLQQPTPQPGTPAIPFN